MQQKRRKQGRIDRKSDVTKGVKITQAERKHRPQDTRRRVVGDIDIDYSVFKKTPGEKALLKVLRRDAKKKVHR